MIIGLFGNSPDTFWEEKWAIDTKKAIHRLKYK